MDMNTIRWDKSMAERCAIRYSRYEAFLAADDKSGVRSSSAGKTDDHWKEFDEAMRRLI